MHINLAILLLFICTHSCCFPGSGISRAGLLNRHVRQAVKCHEKSEELVTHYRCELENEFTEEVLLLRQMIISEIKNTVSELLHYVIANNLTEAFPNACIAF